MSAIDLVFWLRLGKESFLVKVVPQVVSECQLDPLSEKSGSLSRLVTPCRDANVSVSNFSVIVLNPTAEPLD